MTTIFDRPLGDLIANASQRRATHDAGEILIARMASLVYDLVQRAPRSAVLQAAASGSSVGMIGAVVELLRYETPSSDDRVRSMLTGRVALAKALQESGGILLADEAPGHLSVTRATLQNWRDKGRVLALQVADGSFVYPVGQFEQPSNDATHPRPYKAIEEIRKTAGDWLTVDELIGLLVSRQDFLANADGARTGFQALADGDAARVIEMVRHVATPADEGAPPLAAGAPIKSGSATVVR
jgi:hypothetical protein